MHTTFFRKRLGFVENVTKTFWCVFSVHSAEECIDLQSANSLLATMCDLETLPRPTCTSPIRYKEIINDDTVQ